MISASKIAAFRSCPRRWFLDRVDPLPFEQGAEGAYGDAIHLVAENYHKHGTAPDETAPFVLHRGERGRRTRRVAQDARKRDLGRPHRFRRSRLRVLGFRYEHRERIGLRFHRRCRLPYRHDGGDHQCRTTDRGEKHGRDASRSAVAVRLLDLFEVSHVHGIHESCRGVCHAGPATISEARRAGPSSAEEPAPHAAQVSSGVLSRAKSLRSDNSAAVVSSARPKTLASHPTVRQLAPASPVLFVARGYLDDRDLVFQDRLRRVRRRRR